MRTGFVGYACAQTFADAGAASKSRAWGLTTFGSAPGVNVGDVAQSLEFHCVPAPVAQGHELLLANGAFLPRFGLEDEIDVGRAQAPGRRLEDLERHDHAEMTQRRPAAFAQLLAFVPDDVIR